MSMFSTLGDVVVASELHDFSVRAAVFGRDTTYRAGGGPMAQEVDDFIDLLAGREQDLGNWNEVSVIGQPSPQVDVNGPDTIYGDETWRDKVRKAISRPQFGLENLPTVLPTVAGSTDDYQ